MTPPPRGRHHITSEWRFIDVKSRAGVDELLLNALRIQRRIDAEETGRLIQKGDTQARAVLERLRERELVDARGALRGQIYMLAAPLYKRLHKEAETARTKGLTPLQQEQMILEYERSHGIIRRAEAAELCKISERQATYALKRIAAKHPRFKLTGERKSAHYVWAPMP